VGYLKRYRSMVLVLAGTLLMATSIFWEYVRMRPDYLQIVKPWSQRGYDITQGYVIAAIALFVLLLAVLLTTKTIGESLAWSLGVTSVTTIAAIVLTLVTDASTITPAWPLTWSLSLLAAGVALAALTLVLPEHLNASARRSTKVGVFFGVFFGGGILLTSLFSGSETEPWVIVLIGFVLVSALVILRDPVELASYRLLINVHVAGWLIAITSPAAVRKTLQGLQFDESGGIAVAELKDIQITSGMLIAVFGGLIAFAGTVALWANRRDHLTAERRSQQQLEAARKSAEELGSAL
jgi:hypothetical protein